MSDSEDYYSDGSSVDTPKKGAVESETEDRDDVQDVAKVEESDSESSIADDENDEIIATKEDYEHEDDEIDEEEPEYSITESEFVREIVVVRPENRLTSNILSSFEMTEIVSIRATQIAQFNNCMVDISGLDDPIKMAERELMARKCPLILVREVGSMRLPDGKIQQYVEHWSPNHMTFSQTFM